MTREWLETIRALAHKSTLGQLLMIAPPGSAESDNMRCRLDLLADFAQHVVEVTDDDWVRSGADNRNVFTDGNRTTGEVGEKITHKVKPPQERRLRQQRRGSEFTVWPKSHERRHWLRRWEDGEFEECMNCDEGEAMRYLQHGETGRSCTMETQPSQRYYEITEDQYKAATTGSRSDPPIPDRRTGPPDRRLTEQLVHSLVGGRMWQKQRLVDYGRRSTDKR